MTRVAPTFRIARCSRFRLSWTTTCGRARPRSSLTCLRGCTAASVGAADTQAAGSRTGELHLIDLAQWANGTDRSGPVEVEGKGEFPPADDIFDTAYAFEVNYKYENGVTMTVNSKGPGITFVGAEGYDRLRWLASAFDRP